MRKYLPLTLLFLMTVLTVEAQTLDSAPSGKQYYLPVEGGSIKERLDTITPINDLIKRLEKPWELVETGKKYWIGYTNDMFSIAAHDENSIKPLINFIGATKNFKAKIGAVYTLHLIGIRGKIAGRFYEEFTNKAARNALLYLLKYKDLTETIMTLLGRDPWQSDVPKLFTAMQINNTSCWSIVNGLLRYRLKGIPLQQPIPDNIGKLQISFAYTNTGQLEPDYDFEAQLQEILNGVKSLNNPLIHLDDKLFGSKLWGTMRFKIHGDSINSNIIVTTISSFLNQITRVEYGESGNKMEYYINNNELYICSSITSKTKLLKWWIGQSGSYKQQFTQAERANKEY